MNIALERGDEGEVEGRMSGSEAYYEMRVSAVRCHQQVRGPPRVAGGLQARGSGVIAAVEG